jgi:hypothetical protein
MLSTIVYTHALAAILSLVFVSDRTAGSGRKCRLNPITAGSAVAAMPSAPRRPGRLPIALGLGRAR